MADILAYRLQIIEIAAAHGAHHVRLFGSLARGEQAASSDIDLLVQMDDDRSLVDQVAIMQDIQDLLGTRVDVVPEDALHQAIRSQVLKEAVEL